MCWGQGFISEQGPEINPSVVFGEERELPVLELQRLWSFLSFSFGSRGDLGCHRSRDMLRGFITALFNREKTDLVVE